MSYLLLILLLGTPADWDRLDSAVRDEPDVAAHRIALGHYLVRLADELADSHLDRTAVAALYAGAEARFARARELEPRSADAAYGMALARDHLARFARDPADAGQARVLLAACLSLDPAHARGLALHAHHLYDARMYAPAARALAAALSLTDLTVADGVRHGHCLYALRRHDDALEAYVEALRRHPNSDAPIRSGLYYLAGQDWKKAVPYLRRALERVPDSPHAHYYLGHGLLLSGRPHDAANAFAKALALDPEQAVFAHYLGTAEEQRGRLPAALDAYRAALAIDPTFPHTLNRFDLLARTRPTIEASESLYEDLIRLAPENPWLHNNYGYHLRSWAERQGTALDPAPPDPVRRRLVRATEVYEIAARLAPRSPQLQSDTGLTFEFYPCTRDDVRARRYFERAVALYPDGLYRDAWNGLLRIEARAGDWEALRDRAARLVKSLTGDVSAIAPSGEGPPRELDPRARAAFLMRARAALRLAERKLAEKE